MFYLGEAWGGYFLFFWCSFSHGGDSNQVAFLDFLCPITYSPQGKNNNLKLLVILQWKTGDFSHFSSFSLEPGVSKIYVFVLLLYAHILSMKAWPQSQGYLWLSLSNSLGLY